MKLKIFRKSRIFSFLMAVGLGLHLLGGAFLTAHAEVIDYQAQAEANRLLPVESNQIDGWPQGPAVSARSAILIEANTGTSSTPKISTSSSIPPAPPRSSPPG